MRTQKKWMIAAVAGLALGFSLHAGDADHEAIEKAMKDFHKAPKGVDPVCKKALQGTATKEEWKGLLDGYKAMAKVKNPPKGDAASWKEKTGKLLAAAQALHKAPTSQEAAAAYKQAVDCKACHSAHKPD